MPGYRKNNGFKDKLGDMVEDTLNKLRRGGVDIDNKEIDVTRELYKKFKNEQYKVIDNPRLFDKYQKDTKQQIELEKEFLKSFKTCDGSDMMNPEDVQERLQDIDMEKFKDMLGGHFYSEKTMNAMVCVANSVYLASSSSLAPNERIRAWITKLKQIGTPSVAGYAMAAKIGSDIDEKSTIDDAFIVKAVRDGSKADELTHEVFVAFGGLNRLRKMVPNFAYVYGFFECSAPMAGPKNQDDPNGKKIATFCSTLDGGNNVVQAVYENIAPAEDFGQVVKTCNGETFMQYFFALMSGIQVANKECGFTHYDLHQENVLKRECTDARYLKHVKNGGSKTFYVPYEYVDSRGEIRTRYVVSQGGIPTVIDYGRSHIEKDGKHYGMPGDDSVYYITQNVYHDESNPIYDAFKFLGMCLSEAYDRGNDKMVAEISPLLRHFEISEFNVHHISQDRDGNMNYALPLKTNNATLESLLDFCIDYSYAMGWNVVVDKPPRNSFILTAVSDRLEMKTNVIEEIGIDVNKSVVPKTILEFYDIMSKSATNLKFANKRRKNEFKNKYISVRNQFISSGNYKQAIAYELERLIASVIPFISDSFEAKEFREFMLDGIDVTSEVNSIVKVTNYPNRHKLFFTKSMLENVSNSTGNAANFSNMRQTIMTSLMAMNYILHVYKNLSDKNDDVAEFYTETVKVYNYFSDFIYKIEDSANAYKRSLDTIVNLFIDPNQTDFADNREYRILYDNHKKFAKKKRIYMWYYNAVLTIPSLFRPYEDFMSGIRPF